MSKMTSGTAIVKSLLAHDVDTVFGIPGAHTYDLYAAFADHADELTHIVTRHEQGAAYMAYGYAKSTGRPGVFSVVPGPGVLNSGAAISTGYGANAPMLCLTAEIPAPMIGMGRGILHELKDQLATLKLLHKWADRINHPSEAPIKVAQAFRHMLSGRMGPVALETPWDVMAQSAPVELDVNISTDSPPSPDPDAVATACKLISEAKNPMIMVGGGAIDAADEVAALASMLQAPVASHRNGRGIIADDDPYGFTCADAYPRWDETDLLIGIGSRLELQYLRWRKISSDLKVIRVDIDPTEMVRLPATVGLVTDAKQGVTELLDGLQSIVKKRASRKDEFLAIKETVNKSIQSVQPQMHYLNCIREVLPRNGFFVEEISQVGFTARFGMPVYEPRTYVTCGYQDNLGFGFNTALGVKVAHPDVPVVSVSGDGGFLFGAQELATAVEHKINVVAIVFNNQAYGNVRRDQIDKFQGRILGSELTSPDFVKLAQSFGAVGYRATSPAELKSTLTRALEDDAPVVIEVPVPRGSEVTPWSFLMPGTY